MNSEHNPHGYLGAICIIHGHPWYVTGFAPPTTFKTEGMVENAIKGLLKKLPQNTFVSMPLVLYLTTVQPMWPDQCKWLGPMRDEYGEKKE